MKALTLVGLLLFFCTFSLAKAQENKKGENSSKTTVSGSFAVGTMYHGFDVGGDFFRGPVQKNSLTITRKVTEKTSISVDFWGQYSLTKKHPNQAEEFDVGGMLTYEPRKGTALSLYVGNFKVNGLSIQKLSLTTVQAGKVGKVPINLSNSFSWFTTSKPSVAKGGVVNKINVSSSVSISDNTQVSVGLGLGIDNGPFGLKGPAAMFFFEGRVERKLNKNWGFFSVIRFSRPIAGETIRKPIVSGDTGLAFRFDL